MRSSGYKFAGPICPEELTLDVYFSPQELADAGSAAQTGIVTTVLGVLSSVVILGLSGFIAYLFLHD
jgi:hypothetical protein